MPDLDAVRRFAGAEGDGEDPVLEMCLGAAVAWYTGAGVPPLTDCDDYDFWVANLAAWMYDNRGNANPEAHIPGYIVTSVHQLRYLYSQQVSTESSESSTESSESSTESSEGSTESSDSSTESSEGGDG